VPTVGQHSYFTFPEFVCGGRHTDKLNGSSHLYKIDVYHQHGGEVVGRYVCTNQRPIRRRPCRRLSLTFHAVDLFNLSNLAARGYEISALYGGVRGRSASRLDPQQFHDPRTVRMQGDMSAGAVLWD